MNEWKALIFFLLAVASVQIAGGLATFDAVREWYPTLAKPFWTPPSWVFGPVWTALYAMIAVAGWRLWRQLQGTIKERLSAPAMQWYGAQLGLNLAWSVLFFGMRMPGAAMVDIAMLLGVIFMLMRQAYLLDRISFWLLTPYFLWVAYASTLNMGIWWLN